MSKFKFLIFFTALNFVSIQGQEINGSIINSSNNTPVEFVNIGLFEKNIGTVSDIKGEFSLEVDFKFDKDSVLFSAIGYETKSIKISNLRNKKNNEILLKEKTYELKEIVIKPKEFKTKVLGIKSKIKTISAGFKDNMLGYEMGVIMKIKKPAHIKQLNINVANCTYDTIFYRLNFYKVTGKMQFENILSKPIYIEIPRNLTKDEIEIDLSSNNLVIDDDFLVTVENIKDLGKGHLNFCAKIGASTFYRKTSHGKWESVPAGVSISLVADVEK